MKVSIYCQVLYYVIYFISLDYFVFLFFVHSNAICTHHHNLVVPKHHANILTSKHAPHLCS